MVVGGSPAGCAAGVADGVAEIGVVVVGAAALAAGAASFEEGLPAVAGAVSVFALSARFSIGPVAAGGATALLPLSGAFDFSASEPGFVVFAPDFTPALAAGPFLAVTVDSRTIFDSVLNFQL
jgi:hypothetical protein